MNNGQELKVTKGNLKDCLGHIVSKTFLGYDCMIYKNRSEKVRLTLTGSEINVDLTKTEKDLANLYRCMK
jgi:hypothetical protein